MVKNKLREIREKRRLSQNQLSQKVGISHQQISRYESGQQLTEESIRKICIALECNADYLLGLIDDDKETNDVNE